MIRDNVSDVFGHNMEGIFNAAALTSNKRSCNRVLHRICSMFVVDER